jgi:hypothetical protein
MAFDRSAFINDLLMVLRANEVAAALDTPDHHREQYVLQFQEHQKRIDKVFEILDRVEDMQSALLRICYDDQVSEVSSNLNNSPFHLAFFALGGKMEAGRLMDNEISIRQRINHAYQK